MELCKKKNQDRLWMDEIAAMQASRLELPYVGTSGIILAGEENYPTQIGGLSGGKQNGSVDASVSDSGSLDLNQGTVEYPSFPLPPNNQSAHKLWCTVNLSGISVRFL